MAGRGTDIVLGGNVEKQIQLIDEDAALADAAKQTQAKQLNDEWQSLHDHVVAAGGLHIIGTERHESRRVDNQLRGRSGRQGDPGSSAFLSVAGRCITAHFCRRPGARHHGSAQDAGKANRSKRASFRARSNRRNARLKRATSTSASNCWNTTMCQRSAQSDYQQRNELLESQDVSEMITSLRHGVFTELFYMHVPPESIEEQWDIRGWKRRCKRNGGWMCRW